MWQKVQTAILHYTREPADCPRLKPDTGMLTHLPLGDSGTRLQRHSLPRTSMLRRISLLISWARVGQRRSGTPLLYERRTQATLDIPRRQVHITSIYLFIYLFIYWLLHPIVHLRTSMEKKNGICRHNCTTRHEREGPTET